jgi:NADPH2:quinone reductase
MRRGRYLFAPRFPFVPGYEVIGEIAALGSAVTGLRVGQRVAALIVHGGYAEQVLVNADELVPVPDGVDDAAAVALILNYVTAYQALTRSAQLQPGQSALVMGASGGVGSALLELLALHGVQAYGAASVRHHDFVRSLGATPLDARGGPLDRSLRDLVPAGVDAALDGLGGKFVAQAVRAMRRGGTVVGYGFSSTMHEGRSDRIALTRGLLALASAPLLMRRARFYGITALYRTDKRPFLADLPVLFEWLRAGKLAPRIHAELPLLAAAEAGVMLERGGVQGKIVHLAAL